MQAEQLRALRQSLDDTQEVLQREQHRVQLLEAELLHLRSAQSAYLYRRSGDHASVSEVRPIPDRLTDCACLSTASNCIRCEGCGGRFGPQRACMLGVTHAKERPGQATAVLCYHLTPSP